jgi:hypothetical protein
VSWTSHRKRQSRPQERRGGDDPAECAFGGRSAEFGERTEALLARLRTADPDGDPDGCRRLGIEFKILAAEMRRCLGGAE